MESAYLKTLIEVVEKGSFSKAAETLCISQSAVSRRIKFIEDQYGYPLLDRSSSAPQPTAAGQVVIEKAKKILSIENELVTGLESLQGRRTFALCCTPAFGISYLPRVLQAFMLRNADLIDLKFVFDIPARIVEGLQDGLYDLAVIEHCEAFDLGGFSTITLPSDEVVFISSRPSEIPPGEVEVESLLDSPLLTRKEGCCSRTLLEANLARVGRRLADFRKVAVVDDIQVILSAVAHGGWISFLSRSVAQNPTGFETLSIHRAHGFQHLRHRTLVFGEGADHCPLLTAFRDAITGVFEREAASP